MAWLAIRYSVGSEHAPGDPWGRSAPGTPEDLAWVPGAATGICRTAD